MDTGRGASPRGSFGRVLWDGLVSNYDLTDWFILGFVVYAGTLVWRHFSDANFATFCGLAVLWHGLRIYDQKKADAP